MVANASKVEVFPKPNTFLRFCQTLKLSQKFLFCFYLRPCVGDLGLEPVESETFDKDGSGNVHFLLFPNETFHIPISFISLVPHFPANSSSMSVNESDGITGRDCNPSKIHRTVNVRVISGTHGHVVFELHVHVIPFPFSVHRTIRYFEPENTIFKRKISVSTNINQDLSHFSKFIHCVENGVEKRVTIDYDMETEELRGSRLNILLRYRCPAFPYSGSFYLLVYDDQFRCSLNEVWHVFVQTRQKLDIHGVVGSRRTFDLVIRGDRFSRRIQAFSSCSQDILSFSPHGTTQMVTGVFNKISGLYIPKLSGHR